MGKVEFSVPESINTTTIIGSINVTDADLDSSNKIRFSIKSGASGRFYIDSQTG